MCISTQQWTYVVVVCVRPLSTADVVEQCWMDVVMHPPSSVRRCYCMCISTWMSVVVVDLYAHVSIHPAVNLSCTARSSRRMLRYAWAYRRTWQLGSGLWCAVQCSTLACTVATNQCTEATKTQSWQQYFCNQQEMCQHALVKAVQSWCNFCAVLLLRSKQSASGI